MRLIYIKAASKVSVVCRIRQNFIFIRRVPPYHHFFLQILKIFFRRQLCCQSSSFTELFANICFLNAVTRWKIHYQMSLGGVKPTLIMISACWALKIVYKTLCHAINQPHLPNHTWFWVINMFSIAVEPSTYGHYGGKSQNGWFSPPIGFQWNPITLSAWFLIHGHSI